MVSQGTVACDTQVFRGPRRSSGDGCLSCAGSRCGRCRRSPLSGGAPATRFLGPGLLIWPVDGLAHLASEVERLTVTVGKPPPSRSFFGHVTLARGRQGLDLRRAPQVLTPLAMSWAATSLTLVESELHPDGARYRVVDEFPFPCLPAGPRSPRRACRSRPVRPLPMTAWCTGAGRHGDGWHGDGWR